MSYEGSYEAVETVLVNNNNNNDNYNIIKNFKSDEKDKENFLTDKLCHRILQV